MGGKSSERIEAARRRKLISKSLREINRCLAVNLNPWLPRLGSLSSTKRSLNGQTTWSWAMTHGFPDP